MPDPTNLESFMQRTVARKSEYIKQRWKYVSVETGYNYWDIWCNKELAIITHVQITNETDRGEFCFETMIGTGSGAHHVEDITLAAKLMKDYDARELRELNGKPIYVIYTGSRILWLEPCPIEVE